MTTVNTKQINLPSDPAIRKQIQDAIDEASNSFLRVEGEKDFQKNLFTELSEKTELPKGYLKQLANLYHQQNYATFQADKDNVSDLYETIFNTSKE